MKKYRYITYTAILTAMLSIISFLSVPIAPVPISLQCFIVSLGGYVCGAKVAVSSTALYIALGAIGLPVFTGFRGGFGVLTDYTGGFIWGFLALALFCGLASEKKLLLSVAFGLIGLIICYVCGALQFWAVSGLSFVDAILASVMPGIIKDIVLLVIAKVLSAPIIRAIKKQ